MARPSPSPPCVRVVVLSACRNRSKIAEIISLGMPAPLSLTWTCAREATRSRRTSTRPPRGVNFTAFDRRFQNTCWRRPGRP